MASDGDIERDIPPSLAACCRREVFRTEELSAADLEAILTGMMWPRQDYLNAELE